MSEKEFDTNKVTGDGASTKITLDSILKEYDEKQALNEEPAPEESAPEEADIAESEASEDLSDEFEYEEYEEDEEDEEYEEDEEDEEDEDFDDSDMKIAQPSEELETEKEIIGGAEDKSSIMDEISHRFEDVMKSQDEELDSATTADFERVDDTSEVLGVSEDIATLIKAFDNDGYDISTSKKKKGEKENEPSKKEHRERYDVNGERLDVDNPFDHPEFQCESKEDIAEVAPKVARKLVFSCLGAVGVFVLTLLCIYLEYSHVWGLPALASLAPGKLGAVYGLVALQLMFFGVIIKLKGVYKGAVDLFCATPSPESVTFLGVLAVTIHTVLSLAMDAQSPDMILLCSVGLVSLLVLSVKDFLTARVEYMSFAISSGEAKKYAFKNISDTDDKTSDNIRSYVPEDSTILDVRRVDFVKDFFARFARREASDRNVGIILLASSVVSLIVGVIYYINNKDLFGAFAGFLSVFLAASQSCVLLSSALAEAVYADAAAKRRCAFVGHDLCAEYDNVSVVSFKDTEVFPPKDIKVTNIHTYGDVRIDSVIVTMARIFSTIGGPLSSVFTNSISGISLEGNEIELVDIAPDGLWLKIDGGNAYLGTAGYMLENSFVTPPENPYEAAKQNGISVLYLAMSNQIVARFSIKYTINPHFEKTLRSLYTQNVCARIKTLDPCINNDFIRQCLRRPESLFSVVKAENPDEFEREEKELSSGLVCSSNEQALLYAFLLVRKMKNSIRFNNVIKIVACAVGLAITSFMLIAGLPQISAGFILLLQIFWLFPMTVSTIIGAK